MAENQPISRNLSTAMCTCTGRFVRYNNDSNFLQKSSAEKTKIATIFYLNARQVCKMQFHWSSQLKWQRINQSAAICLPPCTLAYDVMPFYVKTNMTTGEVMRHLLINCPLFLTRDGHSMSATRCQHLMVSGLDTMSTRILGHCQMLGFQEFT